MLKNSFIYLGSSIVSKSIPFLLLPIMTKYLSTEEYGILSIYLIFIAISNALVGMNIHANISKMFFKVSKKELSMLIGNILYVLFISFFVYLFITYILYLSFDSIFSISSNWLLLLPFISLMFMVNEINTTILRNEERATMFGIFEISNMTIKMGLTVYFLLVVSMNWYSQVLGTLVGTTIFFAIGLLYLQKRHYITLKYSQEKVRSILNVSIPLVPHVLGGLIIAMSDRLFIEKMVSIEAVGIYSVGYMFGMVVMLFTDAFIKAWSPWFYKSLVEPTDSKKEKIVKYTYIYIVGVFVLAIFISIVGEFILPYFVDEKFFGASEFILWIAIGYAVQGVYKIFFPYLVHISHTSFLAFSTVIAAILNLLFNYIFISQFGTIGAAYATIIAFGVSALLVFWYQQKHFYMPWRRL